MTNEAVTWILIITIFSFSLWLGIGIYKVMEKIDRIKSILLFWEHKYEEE